MAGCCALLVALFWPRVREHPALAGDPLVPPLKVLRHHLLHGQVVDLRQILADLRVGSERPSRGGRENARGGTPRVRTSSLFIFGSMRKTACTSPAGFGAGRSDGQPDRPIAKRRRRRTRSMAEPSDIHERHRHPREKIEARHRETIKTAICRSEGARRSLLETSSTPGAAPAAIIEEANALICLGEFGTRWCPPVDSTSILDWNVSPGRAGGARGRL